ncbi:MAG: toll/interleukin-1 receptor domain-containing protein [Hyphomonadaceae bacterium]|nr:toll/interleukin-1 receptor domain-containing protein [Hyphomonadaceae bacterium]
MSSVSLPILGTGDQGASLPVMLKALIKEAHICLAGGLGLKLFRIVAFGDASSREAISTFDELVRSDTDLQESSSRVPEFDVFVSYARNDLDQVSPIFERLKSTSLNVFIDTHTLKTGDVWIDGIHKAIAKSKVFLALISDNFNHSKYCQQESDHANRLFGTGNPALFPVRIEKVTPEDPFHRRESKLLDQLGIDGLCAELGRACPSP